MPIHCRELRLIKKYVHNFLGIMRVSPVERRSQELIVTCPIYERIGRGTSLIQIFRAQSNRIPQVLWVHCTFVILGNHSYYIKKSDTGFGKIWNWISYRNSIVWHFYRIYRMTGPGSDPD